MNREGGQGQRIQAEIAILAEFGLCEGTENWCEFCSWQAPEDQLNTRLRTCWLALARPCAHSENP
jgi:excinuclease UvrABC helicase subunit UvrB